METVIGVLLIVMGIFLIISVLMQSSKDHRLSGSIAGGAETFFGKQKGKTLDALFNKLTTVVTIIFVVLVLVLYVMQPSSSEILAQMNQNPTEQTGGETGDNTDVTGKNTDNQGENADATTKMRTQMQITVRKQTLTRMQTRMKPMQTPLIPVLKLTVQLTLNNDKSRSNLKRKHRVRPCAFIFVGKNFKNFHYR